MALALQASLLVRYGDPAVADAFCAARLAGDGATRSAPSPPAPTSAASSTATARSPFSSVFAPKPSRPLNAPPDLLHGDHAGEPAVCIDRHQRPEAAQVLVAEQRVQWRVVPYVKSPWSRSIQVGDLLELAPGHLGDLVGAVAFEQAEEAVGGVDDREPGPAVAQEVLVERPLDADFAGDRDRFGSITSATRRPSIRPVIAVCIVAPRAEPLITIPISASQTPPKT